MAVPAAIPLTVPELLTVAMVALLLLHTPPVVVLDKVVVDPTQTLFEPVMAATDGNPFIVTTVVTADEQLSLLVIV